jgi:hypothetical protein
LASRKISGIGMQLPHEGRENPDPTAAAEIAVDSGRAFQRAFLLAAVMVFRIERMTAQIADEHG